VSLARAEIGGDVEAAAPIGGVEQLVAMLVQQLGLLLSRPVATNSASHTAQCGGRHAIHASLRVGCVSRS
jgi:hypothetical protein